MNLTGGKFIAGTGEITASGQVQAIGGIQQKMVGARNAGATFFLTPASNCADTRGAVPAGLRLVKVSTLTQAVERPGGHQGGPAGPLLLTHPPVLMIVHSFGRISARTVHDHGSAGRGGGRGGEWRAAGPFGSGGRGVAGGARAGSVRLIGFLS